MNEAEREEDCAHSLLYTVYTSLHSTFLVLLEPAPYTNGKWDPNQCHNEEDHDRNFEAL